MSETPVADEPISHVEYYNNAADCSTIRAIRNGKIFELSGHRTFILTTSNGDDIPCGITGKANNIKASNIDLIVLKVSLISSTWRAYRSSSLTLRLVFAPSLDECPKMQLTYSICPFVGYLSMEWVIGSYHLPTYHSLVGQNLTVPLQIKSLHSTSTIYTNRPRGASTRLFMKCVSTSGWLRTDGLPILQGGCCNVTSLI